VATQNIVKWSDGSSLTYDRSAHLWHLDVPGSSGEVKVTTGGKVTVVAGGLVSVTGAGDIDLTATGNVNIQGAGIALKGPVTATSTITAASDVVGNSISLDSHVHGGVLAGGSLTSQPQ
jgi:phage baseplate assembly protein V